MSGDRPGDARASAVLDLADLDDAPCAPVDWNEVARQLKALHRREARLYLHIMQAYYEHEPLVHLALEASAMARYHGLRCPRWATEHLIAASAQAWVDLSEPTEGKDSQAEIFGRAFLEVGRGAPNLHSQAQSIFLGRPIYNDVMARVRAGEKQTIAFGDVASERGLSYGTVKSAFYLHRVVLQTIRSKRRRSPK